MTSRKSKNQRRYHEKIQPQQQRTNNNQNDNCMTMMLLSGFVHNRKRKRMASALTIISTILLLVISIVVLMAPLSSCRLNQVGINSSGSSSNIRSRSNNQYNVASSNSTPWQKHTNSCCDSDFHANLDGS